ncbi:MAG: glutathione S-transferase [Pseudomonadota bacterium]
MTLPVFYSFRRCPYAMRARLALLSSASSVELREVLLRDKTREFLAASPSATVPTLVLADGRVIDESLDIMVWALQKNDPEGWLVPEAGSLKDMLSLIAHMDGSFKTHLDRYKYATRYENCDPMAERSAAAGILLDLEDRLARAGYLYGSRASLADMAVLPFIRQFANADRAWFDAQDWPILKRWLESFVTSARFAAIMEKYKRWQAGDPVMVFGNGMEPEARVKA